MTSGRFVLVSNRALVARCSPGAETRCRVQPRPDPHDPAPTGYYKVPSLKGLWYRGPLEHNGSVATLEDWFDPRSLRDN